METTYSQDGTVIGSWRSGSGPEMLLVHGTSADHTRWAPLLPLLEPHFTVYTMDRRGRGSSSDAPDYHILREAEDVAAVVEAIGGPVFVLGHSYGALCSLEASLLTGKMRGLILYEPPVRAGEPIYPPDLPDRMQLHVNRGEPEAALEVFFREVVRMPESELSVYRQAPVWKRRIALTPTISRELTIDRVYRFDAEKFASQRVPTLLMLGGDSPEVFRRSVCAVHAALPHSRVEVLRGQGHVAMDSVPALFVEQVRRFFLDEQPPVERPPVPTVSVQGNDGKDHLA